MSTKTYNLELIKAEMTDEIGKTIANYGQNADTIDEAIKKNQDDINSNTSDISTNKSNISKNADDISNNENSIKENADNISSNKNKIDSNKSSVDDKISTIEGNIATNKSNINDNKNNISTKADAETLESLIMEYDKNEYANDDKANEYDDKPNVAVMEVNNDSSFPHSYGTLVTFWSYSDRAFQIFTDSDHKIWIREVHTNSNPDWSGWIEMEAVDGSQEKADQPKKDANNHTDDEIAKLKETIDDLKGNEDDE